MKTKFLLLITFLSGLVSAHAEPVRVLVWDERQDRQAEAYDNFLGNEIAKRLGESADDLEIRSFGIDDPEQGLAAENLDWADVVIWWGHVRQWEISSETAKRKLMKRLRTGSLDMIFLHSAHWATPFMEAMNERTIIEAKRKFPNPKEGKPIEFEFIPPAGRFPPAKESIVTPAYLALKRGKTTAMVRVDLPNCCFPAYRPDGEPSTLTVTKTDHPIAKGLPKTMTIPMTEMYDEPFHIPTPDEVIFEEDWAPGEHFRSGMIWNLGKGKIFYFRPGHEQYPVFKQPEMIQILANACRWMAES
ncbi:ThuA domain-containing protein [Verrucomicrobiales bacterium]|nr:ThuA domain-containing protein [Verrucomicrobiales bacterium]